MTPPAPPDAPAPPSPPAPPDAPDSPDAPDAPDSSYAPDAPDAPDARARLNAPLALPRHARVIANPDVWLETAAIDQLARIAAHPACRCAVGLPDLHPGRGIPIGAAFAFAGEIHPRLVGGDAGCGVRVTVVHKLKHAGDALLRRLDAATEGEALPDCDPAELMAAVWKYGPRGLALVDGVPASLAALAEDEPADDFDPTTSLDPTTGLDPAAALAADPTAAAGFGLADDPGPPPTDPSYARQLGTVGGGNHFVELSRIDTVTDKPAARALGLTPGGWAIVAHSGSRGLGGDFARDWHDHPLTDPTEQRTYLARLAAALRYAAANRLVLTWRLLDAAGAARPGRITRTFDLVHNTVIPTTLDDAPIWLHRKGAAPADTDRPTIVLGSRGAPSWIMLGTGRPDTLWSVAHGAGRKMHRSEAIAKLRPRYDRQSLTRTATGGHVFYEDKQLLFAEHPDAYKPIEPIIASLEAAGAARRVAALLPFATFKK